MSEENYRLNRIEARCDKHAETEADIESTVKATYELLQDMRGDLERITSTIYGNGQPGLVVLRSEIKRLWWVIGGILSCLAALATVHLGDKV